MSVYRITTTITCDEHGREASRAVTSKSVNLIGEVLLRDTEVRRMEWELGGQVTTAEYDAAGKLISHSAPGISAAYTYDPATARKTAESVTVAHVPSAASYAYTDSGRLSDASTDGSLRTYRFDTRGNLTRATEDGVQTTFSSDGNDRLTTSQRTGPRVTTSYAHDALGRRASSTSGGVTTSFGWDDASRLVTWRRGSSVATYTYDAAGQRTQAVLTEVLAEGSRTTTTTYAYDGITLLSLAATQGASAWRIAYLYDEQNRPYAAVHTSGTATPTTFHIATNDRGDVVALATVAGAVFARYTYDPYGAVISHTANGVANSSVTTALATAIAARQPLRYAGYVYDAHSQTYYLSQRHYDPATMRFLSKDPARADGEESAYQYCAGDPVGKVDPTGLRAVRIVVPPRLSFWQSLWGYHRLGHRYYGHYLWIVRTRGVVSHLCAANPFLASLKTTLAALQATIAMVASIGGIDLVTGLVSVGVPNGTIGRDAVEILAARARRQASIARRWEKYKGHMSGGVHKRNQIYRMR